MKTFESIWSEYENELSSFVLSRVYDVEIQKEIMQEVALKIYQSLHQQNKHLRGWVYQITKNTIVDYYRKMAKPLPQIEEREEPIPHMMSECLKPMLEKLTSEEKELLELHYIQEFSIAEITQSKQLPFNTVKSKLYRAKRSLGKAFFSCCTYERDRVGNVVDFTLRQKGC